MVWPRQNQQVKSLLILADIENTFSPTESLPANTSEMMQP